MSWWSSATAASATSRPPSSTNLQLFHQDSCLDLQDWIEFNGSVVKNDGKITTAPLNEDNQTALFRSQSKLLSTRAARDREVDLAAAALEGLVAQHLRAWIDYSGSEHQLAYWRTKGGNEVDFVVYGPVGFWAIEVKHASAIRPRDLRALRAFGEDYPEAQLRLLYRGAEPLELAGIRCLPCESYLPQIVPGEPLP